MKIGILCASSARRVPYCLVEPSVDPLERVTLARIALAMRC